MRLEKRSDIDTRYSQFNFMGFVTIWSLDLLVKKCITTVKKMG